MEIYVQISFISRFSFFLVFKQDLSCTLILPYWSFKHSNWWRHKL